MPDIFPIFLAFSAFCTNTSFISFTQKANLIQIFANECTQWGKWVEWGVVTYGGDSLAAVSFLAVFDFQLVQRGV